MNIIQIDRTNSHHLSLWFWRKQGQEGKIYHSRTLNIAWMYRVWKENNVPAQWGIHTNKAKKENGDKCFDGTLNLGYLTLGYTNWDL